MIEICICRAETKAALPQLWGIDQEGLETGVFERATENTRGCFPKLFAHQAKGKGEGSG